jgi:hypothetical protein
MVKITEENKLAYERGSLCPKCGERTNTFRRPFAVRWCMMCGFILHKEGDPPYDYTVHLTLDKFSPEDQPLEC